MAMITPHWIAGRLGSSAPLRGIRVVVGCRLLLLHPGLCGLCLDLRGLLFFGRRRQFSCCQREYLSLQFRSYTDMSAHSAIGKDSGFISQSSSRKDMTWRRYPSKLLALMPRTSLTVAEA